MNKYKSTVTKPSHFIPFPRPVDSSELPTAFTYPFYHEPHPLALEAAHALMHYIETHQDEWAHNFGFDPTDSRLAIGKMFGILLVENSDKHLGYLCAFSGKLGNKNIYEHFVPPIYDMLHDTSFFPEEERLVSQLNDALFAYKKESAYVAAMEALQTAENNYAGEITSLKLQIKTNKAKRDAARKQVNEADLPTLNETLAAESRKEQLFLKYRHQYWKQIIAENTAALQPHLEEIQRLKEARKQASAQLQKRLFDAYTFLNIRGETKSVLDIFSHTATPQPPAGAGECATPKMLQYAFLHDLKPLAMAEFWWGKSPSSEIRKHKHFYPACRGKCEPILGHMLQGITMDPNPILEGITTDEDIPIIYEDEQLVVINKPVDMLSVPGLVTDISIQTILQKRYPNATGPLLVHRLDMATSGILIAGITKEAHQYLQAQFIKKTVTKRYVALLDGILMDDEGIIDLPLRVDLDNRPHQLVCYEYGKKAVTKYKVIQRQHNRTKVHFYPITGRTHQLRIHAAHPDGLNTPIVGDDLYGHKADRLHLHAEFLEIQHPITKKYMQFQVNPDF